MIESFVSLVVRVTFVPATRVSVSAAASATTSFWPATDIVLNASVTRVPVTSEYFAS